MSRHAGRPTPPPPTLPSCTWPAKEVSGRTGSMFPSLIGSQRLCATTLSPCPCMNGSFNMHGAKRSEHSSCRREHLVAS
eukprot:7248317-Prymnesium_polylepis.1